MTVQLGIALEAQAMAVHRTVAAFEAISKKFRRIMGHADLCMLKAAPDGKNKNRSFAGQAKAG